MSTVEDVEIVIVGGGICGLATALALHRKGIKSVVLERSETLRETGAAIGVFPNGWRALHQLGIDSSLRSTAIPMLRAVDTWIDKGTVRETPFSTGEARCLRRNDLIEALANELPLGAIRFGCQAVSVHFETSTSTTVLQLHSGGSIKAKVVIGCDGANSMIANFIGLKPTRPFSRSAVRGLTVYPDGHGYNPEFSRIRKGKHLVGRIPIDDKTVYWFFVLQGTQQDAEISKDPESIREMSLNMASSYPKDIVEMIKNSELSSLSLTRLRYRAPWDLLSGSFRREAVTVAGDAWHVFGPFLGQGGSAALEDAVVLARCFSKKMNNFGESRIGLSEEKAREALDEYLKERRFRVLQLSLRTHLTGSLLVGDLSFLSRLVCLVLMVILFRDPLRHTRFDIGQL
ncbi:monooxygenase 1-like isoform X2 [Silene latifolia]|uniref:monooxygenase 1-like isoform X2 n=1 Tax=Silene latifolia TaxID=37657 RepID=UPI003D784DDB